MDEGLLAWAFLKDARFDRLAEYWHSTGPTQKTWAELEKDAFKLSETEEALVRIALDVYNGAGQAWFRLVLRRFDERQMAALSRLFAALAGGTAAQRAYILDVAQRHGVQVRPKITP